MCSIDIGNRWVNLFSILEGLESVFFLNEIEVNSYGYDKKKTRTVMIRKKNKKLEVKVIEICY